MSHVMNTCVRLAPAFSRGEGGWSADGAMRLLPPLVLGENGAREMLARSAPLIKDFLAA